MSKKGITALLLLVMTVIAGCRNYPNNSSFEFHSFGKESGNVAPFEVEMNDSTTYDLYLYTRCTYQYESGKLPAVITITSPNGKRGTETIELEGNLQNIEGYISDEENSSTEGVKLSKSSEYYDIKVLYRSNIHPVESGKWNIEIYIPNIDNVLGVGIESVTIAEK